MIYLVERFTKIKSESVILWWQTYGMTECHQQHNMDLKCNPLNIASWSFKAMGGYFTPILFKNKDVSYLWAFSILPYIKDEKMGQQLLFATYLESDSRGKPFFHAVERQS